MLDYLGNVSSTNGLDLHPFVKEQNGTYQVLPPQTVPLREKVSKSGEPTKWGIECMNALSNIAKLQYSAKRELKLNYQLVNGELVRSEYKNHVKDKNEFELLVEVEKDLKIPSLAKNYDIMSQPINTMIGELSELPDIFLVEGKGEMLESDKLQMKKEMLTNWFKASVKEKALSELIKRGVDPEDPEALQSEEQMMQIQQELDALEKEFTPPEVESYMKTTYRHLIEQWAEKELQDQMVRFNIKKMQRIEFSDYLISGERYRHIYQDAFGLKVSTLNPCYVFSHKSPEIEYIQDGDYAGFVEFLSVAALIDKYGYMMTKDQIAALQRPWKETYKNSKMGHAADGSKINYLSPQRIPYQVNVPTKNAEFNQYAPWMDRVGVNTPFMDPVQMQQINGTGSVSTMSTFGLLVVVKAYWMSQRKIGKLYWYNPATQREEKLLVDETYHMPKYIKEVQGSVLFKEEDEINTITWTYINQGWEGLIVENYFSGGLLQQPMYLGIRPNELQFKGELFTYNAKLPICGQYANNRNTKITSLVDRLKNLQFFYNILMNQCYHFFQTEILPFVIMDINAIPKQKGWTGENKMEKWIELAQRMGYTIADTSPGNTNGANNGGQLPKEINLDRGTRVLARLQVANTIRLLALQQVGISDQRLGDIKSTETATGINQSVSRSYTQTSSWFETFFECEREILQMQLDAAQYLQSKKKDLGNILINSAFTNSLLQIDGHDFNLYNLHVYVLKSQEEKRKLEFAQRMAIENNTVLTPMSQRIKMGTSSDLRTIVEALKENEESQMQMEQSKQQLAQQQLENEKATSTAMLEQEDKHFYDKLQNEFDIATINALGFAKDNDSNANGASDILEFYNTRLKEFDIQTKANMDAAKMQNEQQKMYNEQLNMKQKAVSEREKMDNDQLLMDKKLAQAKVLGDKKK